MCVCEFASSFVDAIDIVPAVIIMTIVLAVGIHIQRAAKWHFNAGIDNSILCVRD